MVEYEQKMQRRVHILYKQSLVRLAYLTQAKF